MSNDSRTEFTISLNLGFLSNPPLQFFPISIWLNSDLAFSLPNWSHCRLRCQADPDNILHSPHTLFSVQANQISKKYFFPLTFHAIHISWRQGYPGKGLKRGQPASRRDEGEGGWLPFFSDVTLGLLSHCHWMSQLSAVPVEVAGGGGGVTDVHLDDCGRPLVLRHKLQWTTSSSRPAPARRSTAPGPHNIKIKIAQ